MAVSSLAGGLRLGRLGRYRGAPSGTVGSRRAAERLGGKPGTWGGTGRIGSIAPVSAGNPWHVNGRAVKNGRPDRISEVWH